MIAVDIQCPRSCNECLFKNGPNECLINYEIRTEAHKRPFHCPIREVGELSASCIGENNSDNRKRVTGKMCELLLDSEAISIRNAAKPIPPVWDPETGEVIYKFDDKKGLLFAKLLVVMPRNTS